MSLPADGKKKSCPRGLAGERSVSANVQQQIIQASDHLSKKKIKLKASTQAHCGRFGVSLCHTQKEVKVSRAGG